jgi:hypothetical protein
LSSLLYHADLNHHGWNATIRIKNRDRNSSFLVSKGNHQEIPDLFLQYSSGLPPLIHGC